MSDRIEVVEHRRGGRQVRAHARSRSRVWARVTAPEPELTPPDADVARYREAKRARERVPER